MLGIPQTLTSKKNKRPSALAESSVPQECTAAPASGSATSACKERLVSSSSPTLHCSLLQVSSRTAISRRQQSQNVFSHVVHAKTLRYQTLGKAASSEEGTQYFERGSSKWTDETILDQRFFLKITCPKGIHNLTPFRGTKLHPNNTTCSAGCAMETMGMAAGCSAFPAPKGNTDLKMISPIKCGLGLRV